MQNLNLQIYCLKVLIAQNAPSVMHYRDNHNRDGWRSREERGEVRRENRLSQRYDDIGKFDDQWREDKYGNQDNQERINKEQRINCSKQGQDREKKSLHSWENQEKRKKNSKEFNEASQSLGLHASHKEHQMEESAQPFFRKPTNLHSTLTQTSKKVFSKTQLLIKQIESSLEYTLPKIEYISLDAYRLLSEPDKLKLDKELRDHIEKQIPLEDRIRKEMQLNIKEDFIWTSNSASQLIIWTQSPINPLQREVTGMYKAFLNGSLSLREPYFKMLNNSKRWSQDK